MTQTPNHTTIPLVQHAQRRETAHEFSPMSDEKQQRVVIQLLDRQFATIQRIVEEQVRMADELGRLREEVAQTKTVTESAMLLIQSLRRELAAAVANAGPSGIDPQVIAELANDLDSNSANLAAAVAVNTAVDPVNPPAEPVPEPAPGDLVAPQNAPVEVPASSPEPDAESDPNVVN